jgi:hypothetical protein
VAVLRSVLRSGFKLESAGLARDSVQIDPHEAGVHFAAKNQLFSGRK